MKLTTLVRSIMIAAAFGLSLSPLVAAEDSTADDLGEQVKTTAAKEVADFKAGTPLENLMAAYNGESNASAKYTAYAAKAKAEGYPSVAVLFTAAAASEKIHAENHADVIKRMGGEPKAEIKTPEPKTTAENLKDAAAGENFERDVMYPAYMKVARANNDRDSVRTFNYAVVAEAGHSKLYKETGEKLVQLKGLDGAVYYVCPTCGYTVTAAEYATFTKCPACFTKGSTFAKIM
jgi:rubrerythrin